MVKRYQAAARREEFPQSDWDRGVEAFKKIWAKYWGEAKLWSAKAQRAVSFSGVPADEVEEWVTEHYNCTTSLFVKAGLCNKPMAQPPFQMSGETAAMGGLGAVNLGLGDAAPTAYLDPVWFGNGQRALLNPFLVPVPPAHGPRASPALAASALKQQRRRQPQCTRGHHLMVLPTTLPWDLKVGQRSGIFPGWGTLTR